MHFDEDETWRVGSRHDLFSVALHEAGHGLGLNHSSDSSAVMAPYYAGVVRDLAPDDIAGIRALYASANTPPAAPVANDAFANATGIAGMSGTVTGSNRNATSETGELAHAGQTASKSIWYRWTAPASGSYTFKTLGSDFDTVLAVYTGSSLNSLFGVAANDDATDGLTSEVRFAALAGTLYRIAVAGFNGASGNVTLRWEGVSAPMIGSQPAGRSVMAGQSVAFSVTASGSGSLSYQWFRNGGEVPGASQAAYTIASARLADAGTYRVRVSNGVGSVLSDEAVLAVTMPDVTPPKISMTTPRQRSRHSSPWVVVSGRASDNQRLARVQYNLNGRAWQDAQGTEAWSVTVRAAAGLNSLQVRTADGAGNFSDTVEREFTYVLTAPLNVRIIGSGRVSPDLNGRALEVGRRYTLHARPDAGSIFSHWSGPGAGAEASLSFVMTENLSFAAHFVSNPFTTVAGRYNGLFFDTNGVDQASSGYFTGKVSGKGKFTASLRWLGARVAVAGQFRPDGRSTNVVTVASHLPLRAELALDFQSKDRLTGRIQLGTRQALLQADRAGAAGGRFAGRYLLTLPGTELDSGQPAVLGRLTISIDDDGNAMVAGQMADGSAVTQSTSVSQEGYLPLHASFDNGAGSLIGWVYITPGDSAAMHGLISWMKEPGANGTNSSSLSQGWHFQSNATGERTGDLTSPLESTE